MMSEQGRCFVLVALQLPELLAFVPLAGHSEPFGGWQGIGCLSLLQWVRLIAGLPCLGLGGAGGGIYLNIPLAFPCSTTVCISLLALLGCPEERSMKLGMICT